jgi:hypothetical protein
VSELSGGYDDGRGEWFTHYYNDAKDLGIGLNNMADGADVEVHAIFQEQHGRYEVEGGWRHRYSYLVIYRRPGRVR